MNPFDQAWAILKTDVLLNREKAMEEYGLDLNDPRVYNSPAFFNYSTTGDSQGLVNLTHPMFAPPEDNLLHEELIESAAHEGTHAAIQNTPEMIAAYKHAKGQEKQGNIRPLVELRLIHELMASRNDPYDALLHDLELGDNPEAMRIRGEEAQKIREQRRKAGRA